jgi:hypothetical protein
LSASGFIERFRLRVGAFTRRRDLPFHRLVAFMLNLCKGSTEQELAGFFATLRDEPVATAVPSRAAFSKARKGLSANVFSHLNRLAIETFRRGWPTPLWQGFRPLAVDGTTFRLSPGEALARTFGEQQSGPTLARASVLYDIAHDLVVDTQVAATCVGEHELAIEHLPAASPGDLQIYDRGYPAFWFFALHLALGVDFCVRLSRSSFTAVNAFWQSDEVSKVVTLTPSAEQRLPSRLFAQFHHRRWSVEESYKRQKRWAEIENLSGRFVLAVRQDINAKILTMNLAAMVRNVAQLIAARRFVHHKFTYQVRGCSALSTMKNNVVRRLFADPIDRQRLLQTLIRYLSNGVNAVRPDRSFPRNKPGKLKSGFHPAYLRTA